MSSSPHTSTRDVEQRFFSDSGTLVDQVEPSAPVKGKTDSTGCDIDQSSQGRSSDSISQGDSESRPIPDGGLRAWLQVLGSFFIFFNITGYMLAFGSFQDYYETTYLPDVSASAISWIGSTQTFLLMFASVFVGPLFDLGHCKVMVGVGSILTTLGALTLGSCKKYWEILLAQGICGGLGGGILYGAVTTLIARSFAKQRSLALGITLCGSPPGAIIYCFIFQGLLPKCGFAWTTRTMAFFMIIMFAISIPLILWRTNNTGSTRSNKSRKLVDLTSLKDPTFLVYTITWITYSLAYWTPFIFMAAYAQTRLGTSRSYATTILIIANATSVIGRVGAGLTAYYTGAILALIICQVISGVICLSWIAATTVPGFVAICALYGCFASTIIPLATAILPTVCPDRDVIGTRLGLVVSAAGFANLIGPPASGALLKAGHFDGQDWLNLQLWCGVLFLVAAGLTCLLWVMLVKVKKTKVFI